MHEQNLKAMTRARAGRVPGKEGGGGGCSPDPLLAATKLWRVLSSHLSWFHPKAAGKMLSMRQNLAAEGGELQILVCLVAAEPYTCPCKSSVQERLPTREVLHATWTYC